MGQRLMQLARYNHNCMGTYGHRCKPIELDNIIILCMYCDHLDLPRLCLAITQSDTRCKRTDINDYGYCRHHDKEWEDNMIQRRLASRTSLKLAQLRDLEHQFPEYVYFIACDGYVKIGRSRNPQSRMKQLSTKSDSTLRPEGLNLDNMKIIKTIKGGHDLEQTLHWKFSDKRIIGEWFKHDTYVAHLIDSLN